VNQLTVRGTAKHNYRRHSYAFTMPALQSSQSTDWRSRAHNLNSTACALILFSSPRKQQHQLEVEYDFFNTIHPVVFINIL